LNAAKGEESCTRHGTGNSGAAAQMLLQLLLPHHCQQHEILLLCVRFSCLENPIAMDGKNTELASCADGMTIRVGGGSAAH